MADAEARFVIDLDSGPYRRGMSGVASATEQTRARISKLDAQLQTIQKSIQRLGGSAVVQRYQAIPKELERAAKTSERLGTKLAALEKNRAAAAAGGASAEKLAKLDEQISSVKGELDRATEAAKKLEQELASLEKTGDVKAFKDLKAREAATKSELAALQSQYEQAGGSASELGEKATAAAGGAQKLAESSGGVEGLAGALKGAGGPAAGLVSKFEAMKGTLAKVGPLALVVTVILAIAAAALKGAIALTQFGLAAADAARSSQILRQAAAGGSLSGLRELDGTISKIRANTAASKAEATQLATELYRIGLRGKGLEDAALTIERFGVLGEETRGKIKALYEQLNKPAPPGMTGITVTADMLPRDQFIELARTLGKDANRALMMGAFQARKGDVAAALKRIADVRFADPARQQMMSLGKLAERLGENVRDIFGGVEIGPFLGMLRKVVMVFDQSTASGRALHSIAKRVLDPIFATAAKLGPFLEAMFEGVVYGLLVLEGQVLKARIALKQMFPGSFFDDIDSLELGFQLGAIAVGALAGGLLAVAAIMTVTAVAALLMALPFLAAAAAVYALYKGLTLIGEKLGLISTQAEDAGPRIQAFADGVASSLPGGAKTSGKGAGEALGAGMVAGMNAKLPDVAKAAAGLAKAADAGVKSAAQIHSPSRLFYERALMMGAGVEQGLEDSSGGVEKASEELVSPPMGGGLGRSGGSASGMSIDSVTITVDAPNLKDPKGMMDEAFLRRFVTRFFDEIRVQAGGAAPEGAT